MITQADTVELLGEGNFSRVTRVTKPSGETSVYKWSIRETNIGGSAGSIPREFRALNTLNGIDGIPKPKSKQIEVSNTGYERIELTDTGDGQVIDKWKEWPRLDPVDKITVFQIVYKTWTNAVSRGVVNRDIKMDNVYASTGYVLSPAGDYFETDGTVWLSIIDWGNSQFREDMDDQEWQKLVENDERDFEVMLIPWFGTEDAVPPVLHNWFSQKFDKEGIRIDDIFDLARVQAVRPNIQKRAQSYSKAVTGKDMWTRDFQSIKEMIRSLSKGPSYSTMSKEDFDQRFFGNSQENT